MGDTSAASALVPVKVREDTETLHTSVSRDASDDYYEIPETLVVEYERAQSAYQAAQDAIVRYIEERVLEPSYVD